MSVQPRLAIAFWLHVGDAHADHQRDGEGRADDAAAELAVLRVLLVEVHRMRVHRQQREPGVVGLGDGAAGAVLVDVADLEILVVAAEGLAEAIGSDILDGD